jgi:uncharacterized membrane protein
VDSISPGFALLLFVGIGLVPVLLVAWLLRVHDQLRSLRRRVANLEARSGLAAPERPSVRAVPVAPAPMAPLAAPTAAPGASTRSWRSEETIGGVWLQNVGSVLLLVAVFFLILWGYTTGRLGPGALVAMGVVLGGLFAWRGDRVARALPAFGHALVGIGLGVAYVSLYLGHFTLRVLPTPAAFALLAATSLLAIVAGQHYRVQSIAALGVLGAFVPQVAAELARLPGFEHHPAGLLAYLAFVDFAVFWLATRSAWGGLALTAVAFTAVTWVVALLERRWDAPVEIGLCALFVGLGLAPLRRWARSDRDATTTDLLLVATAPYALLVASWPYFAASTRETTAVFLAVLAAAYAAAAWWIDARRERQDLWRALVAAAVVFLTAALERQLGERWTPMAWCVEGTALFALGLGPRGRWLRGLGYAVLALGVFFAVPRFLAEPAVAATRLGEFLPLSALTANSFRALVAIAAVFVAARLAERERDRLDPAERTRIPQVLHAAAQLLVLVWLGRHAWNLGLALEMPDAGGDFTRPWERSAAYRRDVVSQAILALAWIVQAAALVWTGLRNHIAFRRAEGYVVVALSALAVFVTTVVRAAPQGTPPAAVFAPFVSLPSLLGLAWLAVVFGLAEALVRDSSSRAGDEANASKAMTLLGHAVLLAWSAAEAASSAAWFGFEPNSIAGPAIASGAWLLQAIVVFAIGWVRNSPFLRRLGLLLFGLTVVKVALFDLQHAGTFVRAVITIAVGTVLLVVSYVYQRARKNRSTAEAAGPTLREP